MSFATEHPRELSRRERILGHLKENPFIAIGFVATCGALTMAIRRMYLRDSEGYQRWLRARVVVQGLTVGAIVAAGVREGSLRVGKQKKVEEGVAGVQERSPSDEREKRAFERRMMEAEEAHAMETNWKEGQAGFGDDGTAGVGRPGDLGSQIPTSGAEASNGRGKPPSGGWFSWFGSSSGK